MIIVLDPGLRNIGWSAWTSEGRLTACGCAMTRQTSRQRDGAQWLDISAMLLADMRRAQVEREDVSAVVYEMPQLYRRRGKAEASSVAVDLMQLCGVLGCALARLNVNDVKAYRPRQWKPPGASKEQTAREAWKLLEADERQCAIRFIEAIPHDLKHNTLDSIAIGLFHFRR